MTNTVSPWVPMTDPTDIKHLGKLGEEANELGSAVARCLIQGIDECEPTTGKRNRTWLTEEIADVMANINLVCERFSLDNLAISIRIRRKAGLLRQWHKMLDNPTPTDTEQFNGAINETLDIAATKVLEDLGLQARGKIVNERNEAFDIGLYGNAAGLDIPLTADELKHIAVRHAPMSLMIGFKNYVLTPDELAAICQHYTQLVVAKSLNNEEKQSWAID